jgi:hypothetical protein
VYVCKPPRLEGLDAHESERLAEDEGLTIVHFIMLDMRLNCGIYLIASVVAGDEAA